MGSSALCQANTSTTAEPLPSSPVAKRWTLYSCYMSCALEGVCFSYSYDKASEECKLYSMVEETFVSKPGTDFYSLDGSCKDPDGKQCMSSCKEVARSSYKQAVDSECAYGKDRKECRRQYKIEYHQNIISCLSTCPL